MSDIIKAPAAEADLLDIWAYIAEDSPSRADNFLDRLEEDFLRLVAAPGMGRTRDEIEKGLRSFPAERGNYVIFYRPLAGGAGVEIARVLRASRDVDGIFGE